jgi:hypothetical protein
VFFRNVQLHRKNGQGEKHFATMQWYKDWAYLTYGNVCNTFTTFLLGHMACGTFLWVIAMGWSLNDVAVGVSYFILLL